MFARTVSLQLKPNSVAEFTQTIEKDIIPLLRKQPGFQDEMVFVVPGGTEAVAISVWDQQEHAEASARGTSPHVLQAVTKVVEGTPQVSTSEVANSTFHTIVRSRRHLEWTGRVCAAGAATAALSLVRQSDMDISRGPCPACRAFRCAHSGQARWAC